LALLVVLPVAALERLPAPENRPDAGLLAQVKSEIPTEVQGWFDAAKAAAAKGDSAEALRLQKQVVAWVQANRPALDVFRAKVLINLGHFLRGVGQKQEALAPTEEAVRILRQVEGSQPEARRFLAMALSNLGVSYTNLGRRQEALAQDEEAVKIRRELARTNPAYLGDLASSLNNLGVSYTDLGRRQEALAPTEEAVKIRRELSRSNPAYLPNLAGALNNLGVSYSDLGRRQEALAPTEEAVKIRRELVKTNPAYLNDLAMALNNLGVSYSDLGRRQEALAPTEEAVKIRRELVKTNPAFQGDLAGSLNNLGLRQLELGQPEIARNAYEEALKLLRPLAASNLAFQEDLQRTQNNLDELNRKEGIRTGAKQVLPATNVSYLPQGDPLTPVKRAVVLLWPTFAGKNAGVGLLGTGFVVRRQGDRAWIVTALHVVRDLESNALATKVEAELFTGPLPAGVVAPRAEVLLSQGPALPASGDEPIVLEVRGLPPDIQALPLATTPAQGVLMVVGHPSKPGPWTVVSYPLLKTTDQALLLDGGLDPGASGSPVLSASRQVVGVVYDSPEVTKSRPIPQVWAFPVKALKAKMAP
jgi:tetratricopeptide (TPR) repeat protein